MAMGAEQRQQQRVCVRVKSESGSKTVVSRALSIDCGHVWNRVERTLASRVRVVVPLYSCRASSGFRFAL